jgi:hypothetical protein
MRKPKRPLTRNEEEFYAAFTPFMISLRPYRVGDQVLIGGDHPHAGKMGEIIAIEPNPADRLLQRERIREALRVKTQDGDECFVMEPKHVRRLEAFK